MAAKDAYGNIANFFHNQTAVLQRAGTLTGGQTQEVRFRSGEAVLAIATTTAESVVFSMASNSSDLISPELVLKIVPGNP